MSDKKLISDNVLQDILAPKKFTATIDSVSVSEELLAEGTVGNPASHPQSELLTSSFWGSYFYCPRPEKKTVAGRTMQFRKMSEEPRNPVRMSTELQRDNGLELLQYDIHQKKRTFVSLWCQPEVSTA